MTTPSATVAKRQLGQVLRQLREELGLDPERTAGVLACSPSKIRRIEAGDVGVKLAELRMMLDLYKVKGKPRKDLEVLASQTRRRRKRTSYGTAIPDWFRRYVNLEEVSVGVRILGAAIPGLLQTEDVAKAIINAGVLLRPDEADRLVQARMARQTRLAGDEPMTVHVIMRQGDLEVDFGEPKIRIAQLKHLRELTDRPNITFQIIPKSRGAHAATGFAFTLLELPNAADGLEVVYLEDLTSARYIDNDPPEQQRYAVAWADLAKHAALSPDDSVAMLDSMLEGL